MVMREVMRKEDKVGDGLEAIAHNSEKENTTLCQFRDNKTV
jgi:hypothetical protein